MKDRTVNQPLICNLIHKENTMLKWIFPDLMDMSFALSSQRLSKELQHKDKIIESLHNKLQQRPDTPSSCQALSETTDQSDRTSLVSDEYRTNEDVDLSSDLDAREFQGEQQLQQSGRGSERDGIVELQS